MLVPHFIENIFLSGLTFVNPDLRSNDIITIKINNKNVKQSEENNQTKRLLKK